MRKTSLLHKALFAIVLILLPIFITFLHTYTVNKRRLSADILEDISVIAAMYQMEVNEFLEAAQKRASDFSSDGYIRDRLKEITNGRQMSTPDRFNRGSTPALNDHLLRNKMPLDSAIRAIHVISIDGRIRASTEPESIGGDARDEGFFINGKNGVSVTEGLVSRIAPASIIVSAPIPGNGNNRPLGVIANIIPISELISGMPGQFRKGANLSGEIKKRDALEAYIVNRERLMITRPRLTKDALLKQRVDTMPISECLGSNKSTAGFYPDYRGVEVAGASVCMPSLKWTVVAEMDKKTALMPLNELLREAAVTAVVVAGLIGMLFMIFLRAVVRPLRAMEEASKEIAFGRYDIKIPVGTTDEIGMLGTAFNSMASEIKARTENVRESEERYRTLFEGTKDAIFIDTPDGEILDINPAGVELFGYSSKDEMMEKNIAEDLYHNPGDRERLKKEIEKDGFVMDFEVVLKKKDGGQIIASKTASAIRDEKGKITAYRGIIRDMTERKRLETKLIHAGKMEAIGQFTGSVSHDFKNILTVIMANAAIIKKRLGKDDPLMANIEHLLNSSKRGINLIQGLLAFSRKEPPALKPVSLNGIVKGVEKIVALLASDRTDIEVRFSYANEDSIVLANVPQMEQALTNLCTNSIDAMPDGGVLTIRTGTAEASRPQLETGSSGEPDECASISVSDTGVGMDLAALDRIFEPFFTTKAAGKGTGLGLAIVSSIVRQHNGYISVYSQPGRGSTFRINLPMGRDT